jgi:hypothetical protein
LLYCIRVIDGINKDATPSAGHEEMQGDSTSVFSQSSCF